MIKVIDTSFISRFYAMCNALCNDWHLHCIYINVYIIYLTLHFYNHQTSPWVVFKVSASPLIRFSNRHCHKRDEEIFSLEPRVFGKPSNVILCWTLLCNFVFFLTSRCIDYHFFTENIPSSSVHIDPKNIFICIWITLKQRYGIIVYFK